MAGHTGGMMEPKPQNPSKMFNKRMQQQHDPTYGVPQGAPPPNRAHNRVGESVQANPTQTMEQIRQQVLQATETKLENQGVYRRGNELAQAASRQNPAFARAQQDAMRTTADAMKAHKQDVIMREAAADMAENILKKSNGSGIFDDKQDQTNDFGIDGGGKQDYGEKVGRMSMSRSQTDRPYSASKILNPKQAEAGTRDGVIHMGAKTSEPPSGKTESHSKPDKIANTTMVSDRIKKSKAEKPNSAGSRTAKQRDRLLSSGFSRKDIDSMTRIGYVGDNSAMICDIFGIHNITPGNLDGIDTKGIPYAGKFIVEAVNKNDGTRFSEILGKHKDDILCHVGDALGLTDDPKASGSQAIHISGEKQNENMVSCVLLYHGFQGADIKSVDSALRDAVNECASENGFHSKIDSKTYNVTGNEISIMMADEVTGRDIGVPEHMPQDIDPSLDAAYQSYLDQMAAESAGMEM